MGELPHQNAIELALPSRFEQLLALGAVIFGTRANSSMASVTVQPRRIANLGVVLQTWL